jgi:Zn-dependent peptidase ImmA (M78 family)
MNKQREQFIEDFTESLLQEHGLWERLPINVSKLIRKLGFVRVEDDFGSDFLGAAIFDGQSKIISVNKKQHIHRKRFTLAHEICHLLWHSERSLSVDKIINYRDTRSSTGEDWREIEANRFAASLLMPRKHLEQAIVQVSPEGEIGDVEIDSLARIFKVSTQAMCFRLTSLGYIHLVPSW